jgi:hypothetical protein
MRLPHDRVPTRRRDREDGVFVPCPQAGVGCENSLGTRCFWAIFEFGLPAGAIALMIAANPR